MSSPKETPGKTIAPHIAKKDLLEVNIVVVYKICYSSKEEGLRGGVGVS
jgi:hypothetical protein